MGGAAGTLATSLALGQTVLGGEGDQNQTGISEQGLQIEQDLKNKIRETVLKRGPKQITGRQYDTYVYDDLVYQNEFLKMSTETPPLPEYETSKALLPSPFWKGHDSAIACYWKVWELAFKNLRRPTPESGFVANYIDTAFNDCIFMWDSAFILMFGRYGCRAFDFLRTLDCFYAKQHPDGFICREIGQVLGEDRFQRFDPTSTGPNVMGWTEWEYYLNFGDRQRLGRVFPVLCAYHHWLRAYRTWQDGSYWSSGWGSGMDNQPRFPLDLKDLYGQRIHEQFSHGQLSWIDACLQQILSARILIAMSRELGRESEAADMVKESELLTRHVNEKMWDESEGFYQDRRRDGTLNGMKSIGAYWALLAEVVPDERKEGFIAHLENPAEFNRPHRVPTLSADHPDYKPDGGYWKGSVWPPTNYMVLRGLTKVGRDKLAHEIAMNHLKNVYEVFDETGTVWENYAPESASQGHARKDFVGWGGLPPTAVLLEYAFGLRPNVPEQTLLWDVRLLDAHGVQRYPYGETGLLDLECADRSKTTEKPRITVRSNMDINLDLRWEGGREEIKVKGQ